MARIAKKSPVSLREKSLKNGVKSLYLDIYLNGKRKYEYLKMYINPAHTQADRELNRQTYELAKNIARERLLSLYDNEKSIEKKLTIENFVEKYKNINIDSKKILFHILEKIKKPFYISDFENININQKFIEYLNNLELRDTSKIAYLKQYKAIYHKAIELQFIKSVKLPDTNWKNKCREREYLLIDEIKKFKNVKTKNEKEEMIKNAFLFACFTGLRFSDITNLYYHQFEKYEGGWRLKFRQKKTSNFEYLDINIQAMNYITDKKDEKIFNLNRFEINPIIRSLIKRAGIEKKITFHSSRHTFAVLLISLGVDIYTTSKLLGHTDVKTTQIYAKILDENKRKAIDKIPIL